MNTEDTTGLSPPMESDDQTLYSWVKNKVQQSRSGAARITHEGIWMTNIAYSLGFDSVFYDTSTRQWKNTAGTQQYLYRNRIHVNKILPRVQNRLSRLCKNPPRFDVRPKSSDPEDKDAARLALDVLMMILEEREYRKKQILLYTWLQSCGHSYIKVGWDPNAGEDMVDPATGIMSKTGDVIIEILSAFEVFPDPLAKTVDDAQWLIQAKVRKLDYFRQKWPEKGMEVKEEDAWLLSAQYETRINSLNSQGPSSAGPQDMALKDAAIELVYYERPGRNYERGRMIVCANGVILDKKELPVGEFPIVKFDDTLIAGKYYSESLITHVRPMQDQYNRLISKRARWTNLLLAGKYIAAKGSGLQREGFNDSSGEIIYYDPVPNGMAPQALPVPTIPEYAYREEESLDRMINDEFGINEASAGQLPSSSIPAIGMQLLVEQDDTRIGIVTEMLEQSWAKVGKLVLKYVTKFYEMDRMVKVMGQNREWEVKQFKGVDLRQNNDVIVVRGSTLPGSKVLKRQELLNLYDRGLLGDPADPRTREKMLGYLEYGDISAVWQEQSLVMQQISRDLDMIEKGMIPEVSELDNHAMHVQEKNKYRLTEKFLRLDDQKRAILLQNIEAHVKSAMNLLSPGVNDNFDAANTAMEQEKMQMMQEQEASAMNATPVNQIEQTLVEGQ